MTTYLCDAHPVPAGGGECSGPGTIRCGSGAHPRETRISILCRHSIGVLILVAHAQRGLK